MMKKYILSIGVLLFVFVVGYVAGSKTAEAPTERTVNSFEECVSAGNPVMESYPRQCRHEGELFVEIIDVEPQVITCTPDQRNRFCTKEYNPVCGLTQVECITTPCDPVPQTYGNGCSACSEERVISYTMGECSV